MEENHSQDADTHGSPPAQPNPPFDARPGQPMQHVQPNGNDRGDHVGPVGHRTEPRIFQAQVLELKDIDPSQQHSGNDEHQAGGKKKVADFHRTPVGPIVRVLDMQRAEDDYRQHNQQSQQQVGAEHHHVKPVLIRGVRIVFRPLQKRDSAQVDRVGRQHRHGGKDEIQ